MSILGPEQDEYQANYKSTEVVKKIIKDTRSVKGKRKEHTARFIETTVSMSGKATKRTLVEFNKKGEKVDEKVFIGAVLDRTEETLNCKVRANRRKLLRMIKDFYGINPKLKITTFGLDKLVIEDISGDEER